MKYLNTFVVIVALAGFATSPGYAVETIDSYASEEAKLNVEMKRVGDFVLFDRHGNLFQVGHVLLDFSSVFAVLAGNPEALGECEFMHAELKGIKLGKPAIHKLRYFFRFEGSVVYLNSDIPTEEVKLTFDLDPSQEIIQGSIVNNQSDAQEEVGTFKMRMRDPEQPKTKK
ncbi:MAG: hypothetical protein WC378_02190 [Opitutaceae bacterium]|jgi:hypothetical protein